MGKYKIDIEVRDSEGKIIHNEDGNKVLGLKYNVELPENKFLIERELKELGISLKALMPTHQIEVSLNHFNNISGTYMTMYSYYVSEGRLVKH